jgi:D-psicose/D-tagatose/L-ribulose 3-epimerase
MNPIGLNLLAWSAVFTADFYPHIERLKKMGFTAVEVPLGNRDPRVYAELKTFLADQGMSLTNTISPPPEANPISPDPAVRKKAVDYLKESVDLTVAGGSSLLAGPLYAAPGYFTRQSPTGDELQWASEVLSAVGDHAEEAGVTLALEALNRFEVYLCNTMEQMKALCDRTDHARVKAMFDTHHAHLEENDIASAIETISDHLVHVHISENNRGIPGNGQVDFATTFEKLHEMNYHGSYVIEAFTRYDTDLAGVVHIWRDLADIWEVAEGGHALIQNLLINE